MEPSNAQGRPTQLNWGRPAALVGRGGSRAIIAVITIINEELQAVLAQDTFASVVPGTPYLYRHEISKNVYDVVVAQAADQTNVPCGNLVNRIVEHLRPEFIILCGIAGGMAGKWGIELGNVVVADHVEGYEQQKRSANKVLLTRLALDHPSFYLRHMVVGRVRQVSAWRSRIKAPRPVDGVPDIREGNLIAGDKLLGDGQNLYQREILAAFDNAVAVDMESFGLARACYEARATRHYNLHYLVVRAISDLVRTGDTPDMENQADRNLWREYAASSAAAFTFELIEHALPLLADEIQPA